MSVSEEMVAILRAHRERMSKINSQALQLTGSLAVWNTRMIFRLANARAPADVKVPDAEIAAFEQLLMEPINGDNQPG